MSRRFTLPEILFAKGLGLSTAKAECGTVLERGRFMQRLVVILAALAALAVPSLAHAGGVAMRVQEVPLGPRTAAGVQPSMHFNMLAVHWIGSGAVSYRVHRFDRGWSTWATSDGDVAPDGGTGRWRFGNLYWTGAADDVQFRDRKSVV